MKILIAEDEIVSRKLLHITLESFGHEVTACENGADAWEKFNNNPNTFQIVVSDWLMPRLDGLQLCKKIRDLNSSHYTYFMLLTANSRRESNYVEAMEAHIDDFMAKPLKEYQIWSRLVVAERILTFINRITDLESLLPMCSYCKKIRDDNNYLEQVKNYFSLNDRTQLNHSVCPCCYKKVLGNKNATVPAN